MTRSNRDQVSMLSVKRREENCIYIYNLIPPKKGGFWKGRKEGGCDFGGEAEKKGLFCLEAEKRGVLFFV
ncbi:hypothetical protein SESBI_34694 [Sesbania bispinosa]|nr:hypothetical protein SESBI_34694 [Sesbania bispinosa]